MLALRVVPELLGVLATRGACSGPSLFWSYRYCRGLEEAAGAAHTVPELRFALAWAVPLAVSVQHDNHPVQWKTQHKLQASED